MLGMHFNKLLIWQRSMALTKTIYMLSKDFPKDEQFGLTSQMRRAAVSVPSNISEGSQRGSNRDFANFILIARGSLAELLTQVLLCKEISLLQDVHSLVGEIEEISRMLHAFHSKLKTHNSKLSPHNS